MKNSDDVSVSLTSNGINICQKNVHHPHKPIHAMLNNNLTPKQAVRLAMLLIKAAMQMGYRP